MGGAEGDPSPGAFRLRVYGEVDSPFEIDFASLLQMPQVEQVCDVHCVTKWTVLDARFTGVRVADLADRAKVKPGAHRPSVVPLCGRGANGWLRWGSFVRA